MLPISLKEPLQRHLEKVKATHEKDLKAETEVSSLCSQLECWNTGKMEYWVLGNWDFGLLEKFILTWEGIC